MLFNLIVAAGIDDGEGMFELILLVVVGRWQVLQNGLNEGFTLRFVQVPVVITIKIEPDLVNLLSEEAIALELRRQLS